jgi:hypothetical protein
MLDNEVQDYVADIRAEDSQLRTTRKRSADQLRANREKMMSAWGVACEDRLKASQWETAKNITMFIPGVNLFAYPLTRYWYKYHSEKHILSSQLVRVLKDEQEDLTTCMEFTRTQINKLVDSSQRLRAIRESGSAVRYHGYQRPGHYTGDQLRRHQAQGCRCHTAHARAWQHLGCIGAVYPAH